MEKFELRITSDGSHTLHASAYNEDYHSSKGAMEESWHVYIHAGLGQVKKQIVRILEYGFGTGLNVLLTANYSKEVGMKVDYHTVELHPLPSEIWTSLNYPQLLPETCDALFQWIHSCNWENSQLYGNNFQLWKHKSDFNKFEISGFFDLVYYDAFSPHCQPELWTEESFLRIFNSLMPGGILVTYCAKGQVRRNLQAAGFRVERLPGAAGKREMLRAIKDV